MVDFIDNPKNIGAVLGRAELTQRVGFTFTSKSTLFLFQLTP
jgi:hypothetical protein